MDNQYRVIFTGKLLAGFELGLAKEKAARRLKTSAEQIEQLFAGRPAVLKRGVSAEQAEQYRLTLERIGMEIRVEALRPAPAPAAAMEAPSFAEDMEKTLVAGPDALSRYMEDLTAIPAEAVSADLPSSPEAAAPAAPAALLLEETIFEAAPAPAAAPLSLASVQAVAAPAAAGEDLAQAFRDQAVQESGSPVMANALQRRIAIALGALLMLLVIGYILS